MSVLKAKIDIKLPMRGTLEIAHHGRDSHTGILPYAQRRRTFYASAEIPFLLPPTYRLSGSAKVGVLMFVRSSIL